MPDTDVAVLDGTTTAPSTSRFRMDLEAIRIRCAQLGAYNDRERAALMGIGRKTLYRWRDGETVPRLDVIDVVCRNLGVTRREIFPEL